MVGALPGDPRRPPPFSTGHATWREPGAVAQHRSGL